MQMPVKCCKTLYPWNRQNTLKEGKTQVEVTSVHRRYHLVTTFICGNTKKVEELSFQLSPLIVAPESRENWKEVPTSLGYDEKKPLNGMLTLPKNVEYPSVVILA